MALAVKKKKASSATVAQAKPAKVSKNPNIDRNISIKELIQYFGATKVHNKINLTQIKPFIYDEEVYKAMKGLDGISGYKKITFDRILNYVHEDQVEAFRNFILDEVEVPVKNKVKLPSDTSFLALLKKEDYTEEQKKAYAKAFTHADALSKLMILKKGRLDFYTNHVNIEKWRLINPAMNNITNDTVTLLKDLNVKFSADDRVKILKAAPYVFLEHFDVIPVETWYTRNIYTPSFCHAVIATKSYHKIKNKTSLRAVLSQKPKVLEKMTLDELNALILNAKEILLFCSREGVTLAPEIIKSLKEEFMIDVIVAESKATARTTSAINELQGRLKT